MTDQQAIQGLWRLVSIVHRGRPTHSSATHYLFSGDRQKEIVPSMVDEDKVRTVFSLDEEADPKEIVLAMDWNGPDGPPAANPLVQRGFYRLSGDDLEMCFGIAGDFPPALSDEHGLTTLRRDHGPVPESRKPSGTPPIEDDVLGQLQWDDNIRWYAGKVKYGGRPIDVQLHRDDDGTATTALARARDVARKIDRYIQLAKALAADQLLDLANEWADQAHEDDLSPQLTADDFMSRIRLESMVFGADGGITFYHNDGDMFWGHCVQLRVDSDDNCIGADIPG